MTIVYFVIAALALAGAAALLWIDRNRSEQVHHQRAVWGETHDFKFRDSDTKLRSVFKRAAMDAPQHIRVRDVAYGVYQGAEAVVFDLEETATIVAVRRPAASSVTVDLRHEDVLAPAEDDVDLLGAMGPRVMFASNLEAARRVCDRRMVTLASEAPDYIEILWNEGNWALGAMPLTVENSRLDVGLDAVRRFADLLRVLPPAVDPQDSPDPRDPHGPTREELADIKTDSLRDKERRRRVEAAEGADQGENSWLERSPRAAAHPGSLADTPSRVEPIRRPAPPAAEYGGPEYPAGEFRATEYPDFDDAPRAQPAPAFEADPTRPVSEPRPTRDRISPPNLPPRTDPRNR